MEGALSELREAIGDDDKELVERKARELRRQRFLHLAGPRFASAGLSPASTAASLATPVLSGLHPARTVARVAARALEAEGSGT